MKTFFEVYEQTDEEKDQWILRSSHITEELAQQWIMELINNNPDYEDINFRIDECVEEELTNPDLS
jgi:serine/threonine protein phosphatase PrpC